MSGERSWYAIRQKAVANLKPTQNFMQKSCNFSLISYFKKKTLSSKTMLQESLERYPSIRCARNKQKTILSGNTTKTRVLFIFFSSITCTIQSTHGEFPRNPKPPLPW